LSSNVSKVANVGSSVILVTQAGDIYNVFGKYIKL
jgi:hypothetical protein